MARGRAYRVARDAILESATRCYHCGCEISNDLPPNFIREKNAQGEPVGVGKSTADHLIPLSDGGPDTPENLVPSCLECNLRRGTKGAGWRSPVVPGYEDW